MTVGTGVTVTRIGPVFDGRLERAIDKAIQDTVQDITERGESMVKRQLYPGHGFITGTLRRSIAGEVRKKFHAIIDTDVVYGRWIEGVSRRNESTRFKGYRMFRRARQALQRMAGRLLQKHITRRLRGLT